MASLADRVFDNGLSVLDTEANRIDITSQEVTTYAEATSTYTLGNSTTLSIGAPADRTGGGREVTVGAVSDATVTGSGTASFYAITNGSDTLYVTGDLTTAQVVATGNSFSLGSFTIGIPDPA